MNYHDPNVYENLNVNFADCSQVIRVLRQAPEATAYEEVNRENNNTMGENYNLPDILQVRYFLFFTCKYV